MTRRRIITAAVAGFAMAFFAITTRVLLDTAGGDGAWKLSTPADLELAGRPQLVEFFHPG